MSLNQIRGYLYKIAKYIGDYNAISKSVKKGSVEPILKRVFRRVYGKITGRGFKFFK